MSVTKMYSVLDKWTDLDKENVVDFTSVDGTVTQARLNGVPVGGGGGGDFTTAEITFSLTPPEGVTLTDEFIIEVSFPYPTEENPYTARGMALTDHKVNIVLYNNQGGFTAVGGNDSDYTEYYIDWSKPINVTGDIVCDTDAQRFIVTGSGTISCVLGSGSE